MDPAETGAPAAAQPIPADTRAPDNPPQKLANGPAYAMLAPWLLGFFGLTAIPMAASLYLSFTDFSLLSSPEWIGTQNYTDMLTWDYRYWASLKVTLLYVCFSVPLSVLFALLVATGLNRRMPGIGTLRSAFYLPSLLGGSVAVSIMWRQLFSLDGLVNELLAKFGISGPAWINSPDWAPWTLVLLHVWQFGAPMVIFLAALKTIPRDLYEAAEMDGAGPVTQFFHVTLPLLTPIIFFNLVMQMIVSFQAFTPAYIISDGSGGPSDSTLFYTLYLYIEGFSNFNMGYAAAMAWALLLIIAAVTGLAFATARFWVYDPER